MRCNNLLQLSFKTSIFSETYIQPSRASIMEPLLQNSKPLSILTKKLHPRVLESLAACRAMFPIVVFCKIAALERNTY